MIDDRPKIAFDLGGVIILRQAVQNFLIKQSDMSVKLTVQKFGADNVFVISKAKQKFIQRNIDLLIKQNFFQITGLKQENYEDKAKKMKQLNITYIVDDSIKIYKDCSENGLKPILFGDHDEFMKSHQEYTYAKSWKSYRKLLEKIPK